MHVGWHPWFVFRSGFTACVAEFEALTKFPHDRRQQIHTLETPPRSHVQQPERLIRSTHAASRTEQCCIDTVVDDLHRHIAERLAGHVRHEAADGRHLVGEALAGQIVAAARRSVGQHHGPVYALQARHICQDLDLWRRRLKEIERDIEGLLEAHEVGKLLTSIDGLGPHSAARIIAAVGDPARFKSAGAFAAYVGVVPGLRQSGKQSGRTRAPIAPMGNARLRRALWMPVLGAVRRNPWLRAFYERLRAAGKPPKLALVAALRKLLHAVYSVAKNRRPFVIEAEPARAA